jgi:hypothetical protein
MKPTKRGEIKTKCGELRPEVAKGKSKLRGKKPKTKPVGGRQTI